MNKFLMRWKIESYGFPCGSAVKNLPAVRRWMFNPWVGKIPWKRKWQPTSVFLPGKSHGQRNLVGYSPWGRKRVIHDLATKPPPPLNNRTPSGWCAVDLWMWLWRWLSLWSVKWYSIITRPLFSGYPGLFGICMEGSNCGGPLGFSSSRRSQNWPG